MPHVPGSTLNLIEQPFGASQVPLLYTDKFLRQAKDWGYHLRSEDLQEFNRLGTLVPFFMAVDQAGAAPEIQGHPDDHSPAIRYAREGRLMDTADVPPDDREPHLRPDGAPDGWWDGYFYSEWQLLQLRDAVQDQRNRRAAPDFPHESSYAQETRRHHLALALLSTRYFPSVVGQLTFSNGAEWESIGSLRRAFDPATAVQLSGVSLDRLQGIAELLLARAHSHDPLRQWWDLVRHSDHAGWFRLRDGALEAVWQRIAAEVLLQAHEALAADGLVPELPVPPASPAAWMPLHDRIGEQPHADGLERALGRLSLSPHPRIVLVLEGATEVVHLTALLNELGISGRQKVRIVEQGTSTDWPNQLAQYVAPSLGRVLGERQLLERGPTALVVAMDAEGTYWSSPAAQDRSTRRLRRIVRAEVEAQGGSLTDSELDVLVQTRTWGIHKYEVANFTNEELELGMWSMAVAHGEVQPEDMESCERLRASIDYVRDRALDLGIAFQRMQWHERKPELARILTPVLLEKLGEEGINEADRPPVIQLALDLYALTRRLSGGGYSLETPVTTPSND